MANTIRQLQEKGIPVANAARYHAQFHFAGRLTKPLAQLSRDEVLRWLEQNPNGMVIFYTSRKREPAESMFSQPYRGESAVLLNADQARKQMRLLGNSKEKNATLPEEEE